MKEIITDWEPRNEITRPLIGTPIYVNSGIIKAVMDSGDLISVARIDYEEYDDENAQYVFEPYWEIIDALPPSVFQGIPGIDMDMRLKRYYRVNYEPIFITERTPSKNREDVRELLEAVGLDYYDRFEWLIRTTMRAANDNLIVERRRFDKEELYVENQVLKKEDLKNLQYGDKVIIDYMEALGETTSAYESNMFFFVSNGIDVECKDKNIIVNIDSRTSLMNVLLTSRLLRYKELVKKQKIGIEQAKKDGKYKGRKPIDVDEVLLEEVRHELDEGIITVAEAMRRTGIESRSTFYRKLRNCEKIQ